MSKFLYMLCDSAGDGVSTAIGPVTFDDLQSFLSMFPVSAKSWRFATDEVKDVARMAFDALFYVDGKVLDLDYAEAEQSPSQWNTVFREYIEDAYAAMSQKARTSFLESVSDMIIG